MANIQKHFVSLVALGSQNPQILNEDFLKINKIIPAGQPPFDQKTNFVSTPPFTTISFGPVEIIVEEQRFQIREGGLSDWTETSIFNIAMNYYKVLQYTPVKTFGLNLNSQIDFENAEEADKFQKLLLPEKSGITAIISEDNIDISLRLRYPYSKNGQVLLTIEGVGPDKLKKQLNFNYEFNCFKDGQTNWLAVESEISNVNNLSNYFDQIINRIKEAI